MICSSQNVIALATGGLEYKAKVHMEAYNFGTAQGWEHTVQPQNCWFALIKRNWIYFVNQLKIVWFKIA